MLPIIAWVLLTDLVILSSIDLSSKMNVGSVTLLRSAPGLNWDMMWERTVILFQYIVLLLQF